MAILKNFFTIFRKQCETAENHQDDSLRTHYYKGTAKQIFLSVEQMFRDDRHCHVTSVSREHGEIAVEVKGKAPCFLIVTVVSVKPLETAVDFTLSTEAFSITGSYSMLRKLLLSYYEKLDRLHTNIGTGKNA
ncbi:MAG: hypothetical protein Q8906_03375 [Bacillota bacterium]|nr:hypothetical protein [Bacillota bacterium]